MQHQVSLKHILRSFLPKILIRFKIFFLINYYLPIFNQRFQPSFFFVDKQSCNSGYVFAFFLIYNHTFLI